MRLFMKIMKELGIALLFVLVILGVLAVAFHNRVPYGKEVPESINYVNIEKSNFDVRGDVEDKANATLTYQTSAKQLESYLTEKIVSPGRFAPFDATNSVSDVPSEVVTSDSTTVSGSTESTNTGSDTTKDDATEKSGESSLE